MKDLSLQQTQKKQSPISIKTLLSTILVASLLGTYLDLFFVGKGIYAFPQRLMPNIFQINIVFTLLGLPILVCIFLIFCNLLRSWQKVWFILIISLLMSVFERVSESLGFFIHGESWRHLYSFVGYTIYFSFIYTFYHRMNV